MEMIYILPNRKQMLDRASKSISYYESLPNSHKKLIPDFMDNMSKIMDCIETNAKVIELFAKYRDGSEIFSRDENDYEVFCIGTWYSWKYNDRN